MLDDNKLVEDMLVFLSQKGIEGFISNFYLDSGKKGNITIGVGHLADSKNEFLSLAPYLHSTKDINVRATGEELEEEWQRLQNLKTEHKGKFNKFSAGWYAEDAIIEMDKEKIADDARQLIQIRVDEMRNYFKCIENAPYLAQVGLLDMIYNAGIGNVIGARRAKPGLRVFFARFRASIQCQDWLAVVVNCHRPWVSDLRNKKVKEFFMHAALEVATGIVVTEVVPPSKKIPATAHQKSEEAPVQAKPNTSTPIPTGTAQKNPKTGGTSKVPIPVGGATPHSRTRHPKPLHENIPTNTNNFEKLYLQLTTPLPNKFLVTSFSGEEGLSEPFCYHIIAYSENLHIKAKDLINKQVSLHINDSKLSELRYFHGQVYAYSAGEIQGGFRQYTLEIRPHLWFLSHVSNFRIFENMTTIEIVKKICGEFHIPIDLSRLRHPLKQRPYCVQYNETTLNFIHRLLEEEGIFYFFRHEKNKHTFVLADDSAVYKPCAVNQPISIDKGRHTHQFCAGKYTQQDFNHETPNLSLDVSHLASSGIMNKAYERYYSPGYYAEVSHGQDYVKKRLQAEQVDQEFVIAHSDSLGLQPAYKFHLKTDEYVVVRVQHFATDHQHGISKKPNDAHSYSNHLTCIPAKTTYRPPHITSKPEIHGVQTATVVGDGQAGQEIAVDQYGRILVRFHWDREKKSSRRIRVAQNMAGKNWGMVFHPRIGQEVVVTFEHGNPDRPMVIGNVYNAEQMTPYELAKDYTQSGVKSKTVNGDGSNEIRFEDKEGEEEFYLHAQKDMHFSIENNEIVKLTQGDYATNVETGKSVLEAAEAIEFKVGSNGVVINQDGIFINGGQVKFNG